MMRYYSFPSTDAAENAATALRRSMPLLHSVYVSEELPPEPDPDFAVFPINSIAPSSFVGNYYPTLFAFNAMVDAPPFQDSLFALPGEPARPEQKSRVRLSVCCGQQDRRQVEAIVRAQPGAESVPYGEM